MNYDNSAGFSKLIVDTFENVVGSSSELKLPVPISSIPAPYNSVFSQYTSFNTIQSSIFQDALYSDNSLAVSAPTGSGKTVIFEFGIVKFLLNNDLANNYKIIYIAPMKAICEERLVDWHNKFSNFGINCISVTGDSENVDFQSLSRHNLVITTPEKWDGITRRWRDNDNLIKSVKLFLIDEIHLLNDEKRGATLEAIVTRMKTLYNLVSNEPKPLRFIGVSATISNIIDIAQWFNTPQSPGKHFRFKDEVRPVKLNKIVIGYPFNSAMSSPFKFDMMLSYKLHHIILQYSCGKPTLVFCSTRKSVEMTSKQLIQNLTITLNDDQKKILVEVAKSINNPKVTEVLIHGVGCHHAGMLPEHRRLIENLFRDSYLPVLITTSTLAMGVNLPAHLVVVKSTKYYTNSEYKSYEESMIYQMIGRAGRPQFDNSGTAVIMTTNIEKNKYENMISGEEPIESYLRKNLVEFINAEVVLQTITDTTVAMQWLSSTFLYIRARKNPKHYGLPLGLSLGELDKRLLEMCQIEINKLSRFGMLTIDSNATFISTESGRLMAKYCVCLETMKLFTEMTGNERLEQILGLISKCYEFQEIRLRSTDKSALNVLNKCRNKQTIRYPLSGKIKTLDMKINCIVQAVLGCLEIKESGLLLDAQRIMRIGERLLTCVAEYLKSKRNCYQGLLSTIILCKCFRTRIWENSSYVSRQLDGIGSTLSNALVTAGKTTFDNILAANPRDLERILNKKPPLGNTLQDQVKLIPKYSLKTSKLEDGVSGNIRIEITLENASNFDDQKMTVKPTAFMHLIVGDEENLLLYKKYSHLIMTQIVTICENVIVFFAGNETNVSINWISEDWAGFDIVSQLALFEDKTKKVVPNVKKSKKKAMLLQQSMDKYFSNVKPIKRKRSGENNLKPRKIINTIKENQVIKTNNQNNNNQVDDPDIILSTQNQVNSDDTKKLGQKIISDSIASYIRSVNKKVLLENGIKDELMKNVQSKITPEMNDKTETVLKSIENYQEHKKTLNVQKQSGKSENPVNRLKKEMIANRKEFLNSTKTLTFEAAALKVNPINLEQFSMENKKKLSPESKEIESQKSITWKSPLIESKIQKYSPNLDKPKPNLDLIRRKFNFPPKDKGKLTYSLADKNWDDNNKKIEEFVSKPFLDLLFGEKNCDLDLNGSISSNTSITRSIKTTVAESISSYNQMGVSYIADRIKSAIPKINNEINVNKETVNEENVNKENVEEEIMNQRNIKEEKKSSETDLFEKLEMEDFFIESEPDLVNLEANPFEINEEYINKFNNLPQKDDGLTLNNYGLHQNHDFEFNLENNHQGTFYKNTHNHHPNVLTPSQHLNLYEQRSYNLPNCERQHFHPPQNQNELYNHYRHQNFPINQHHHHPPSSYYQNGYNNHCRSYPTSYLELQRHYFENQLNRYQSRYTHYKSPYFQDIASLSYPCTNEGCRIRNEMVRKPRISQFENFEGFNQQGELDYLMPEHEPVQRSTDYFDERRRIHEQTRLMKPYFDSQQLNNQFERMKRKYDRFDDF
nr:probable ATP-dependent DNA helicase HFM1 [Onthophagus taurus]